MFEPVKLDDRQYYRCLRTISSNTFYMIVASTLVERGELSVVRMGDGEKLLMDMCEGIPPDEKYRNVEDPNWMERLGCLGIDVELLRERLNYAATECTYFAPSVTGITRPEFELYSRFPRREQYVDNFFVNAWTEDMKINLFKAAGHVLFIHRNVATADAMQIRAKYGIGVKVTWLKLDNWQESESVISQASKVDAPLVLFSGGPASKYIGPRIAKGGNVPKVVLDLGNAADHWTLLSLKDAAQGRR